MSVHSISIFVLYDFQNGKAAAADLDGNTVTCTTRQLIVRLTTHKLADMYGNYPGKQHIIRAAVMLGELLDMPSSVFYDPKSFDGFLPRCLQNFRRKLSGTLTWLIWPATKQLWPLLLLFSYLFVPNIVHK